MLCKSLNDFFFNQRLNMLSKMFIILEIEAKLIVNILYRGSSYHNVSNQTKTGK